jgi:hypothetical protein
MKSSDLKELGFKEEVPLGKVPASDVPYKSGIFVIVDKSVDAGSDILYIGRAKNLVKRIFGDIIGGEGKKSTQKLHQRLFKDEFLGKVEISWMMTTQLKKKQAALLKKFKREHKGFPIWNA